MNHSADKPSPAQGASRDDLLDEFEDVLYRFARIMGTQADKFDDNLTPPQFMILKMLEHRGPMRISDIATHMGVKNPAASMMLNAMFEHDLVDRHPDPDDRRATLVSVSKLGAKELRAAEKNRRVLMRSMTERMNDEEITALISGLKTLAASASAELGVNGLNGTAHSQDESNEI